MDLIKRLLMIVLFLALLAWATSVLIVSFVEPMTEQEKQDLIELPAGGEPPQ